MSTLKKAAIILLGTPATVLYLAVPAGADPDYDPCRTNVLPICRLVPIMPDLDHDIDLSQPDTLTDGQDGQIAGNQPGTGSQSGTGNQPGASNQHLTGNQPGVGQNGG
jgi:hypothetical protein